MHDTVRYYLDILCIKIIHSVMKLKPWTLKSMIRSLHFTRSSMKIKLLEITNEFKKFKFQHNLRIEFTKKWLFF